MALPSHSSFLQLLLLSLQWNYDERELCWHWLAQRLLLETALRTPSPDTSIYSCVHPAEHLPLAQITLTKIPIFIKSPKTLKKAVSQLICLRSSSPGTGILQTLLAQQASGVF